MRGFNLRRLAAGSLALVLIAVVVSSLVAHAATGAASGLSISPLRQELTLKPGQADKIDVTLKNITGGAIIAKAKVRDFTSDNVTGNPKVITDPNYKSAVSIRSFLVGLDDVSLAVGEQKSFSIPVQVPDSTVPGAYYGLIEYQAVPVDSNGNVGNNNVALSASVSQLVFISVPGNVTDKMKINALHIYKDTQGNAEGLFFTSVPKTIGVELRNIGNAFATPFGHVSLQNSSGTEIYAYEMNGGITRSLVLPNSNRIFKDPLKNLSHPGRYTIVANLSYGPGSTILTAKKSFWYIPVWAMAVVAAIVLALVGVGLFMHRLYKRNLTRHFRN
jgi:hypothetical protein